MTTFATALDAAIDAAPSNANHLGDLARQIWQAWSSGTLSDEQAQAAAVRLHERRAGGVCRPSPAPNNEPTALPEARAVVSSGIPPRKPQQSPDKLESIARRRRLAASGGLPPRLAQLFTVSEQAALRIALSEAKRTGSCSLYIDEIAAKAGTCRTVVKDALRRAAGLGMLLIRERRRAGQKSLTNIVTVLLHELRTWLGMRDKALSPQRPLSIRIQTGIRGGRFSDPCPSARAG